MNNAEKFPGVKAVITANDVPRGRFGSGIKDQPILAHDEFWAIGAVAAIAAETADIAEEAVDLIEVEYEELPAVLDPEEAMKPGAPQLHEEANNIRGQKKVRIGDIEEGFREADYVFKARF